MRTAYLLVYVCTALSADATLETTKAAIVSLLVQNNPRVLTEFSVFFTKHDERVRKFFDRSDNSSLRVHIQQMEQELVLLGAVCRDKRFSSVEHILCEHYNHVAGLLAILKQHINSRDTLGLALKLRKFKNLLPHDIAKKRDIALFWALHHRLRCL